MHWVKRAFFTVFSPVWRTMHQREILIFYIHEVIDAQLPTSWQPLRPQFSVQRLQRGLAALARHYHFVSLEQAVAMLRGELPFQPYSVVLTFDDGYRNNVTHALPILRQYGAPATFFLATGHMDRREPFWYDRLDYAIQHLQRECCVTFREQQFSFAPGNEEQMRISFKVLRQMIKYDKRPYGTTMEDVSQLACQLEERVGFRLVDNFEEDHFCSIMSWSDVKSVMEFSVSIGSHTMDHVSLDRLDACSVRKQLLLSKKRIEERLMKKCSYFCYPYGAWCDDTMSMVRKAGYEAAVTTIAAGNRPQCNLYNLKRMFFPEV